MKWLWGTARLIPGGWTLDEKVFILIFLLNLLAALLYLLAGTLIVSPLRTRKERKAGTEVLHDNRRTYLLRFLVMALCPVVGPLFFCFSYLLFRLPLWMQPHLEDVVFSKERVRTHIRADEERCRNLLPLEEAMSVNEKRDLRLVMMNTIRGDVHSSLGAIILALNSEDSETSHYAASVLTSELDAFRIQVRRLRQRMEEEAPEETGVEEELIPYMDGFLKQNLFHVQECRKMTAVLDSAAQSLFDKNPRRLTPELYESICMRLMDAGDMAGSEKWCLRLAGQYPDCLASYTCRLKLYFAGKNRDAFFETLNALRDSDVVIDRETLELVKVFI